MLLSSFRLSQSSSADNRLPYTEPSEERWHGSNSGYTEHACRGPRCRAAHTAANADYRRREKAKREAAQLAQMQAEDGNGAA
jgi:hypothetical protein